MLKVVQLAFMMIGLTTCVNLIYRSCMNSCILMIKGVQFTYVSVLGRVILSRLILMMVHMRFIGSLAVNILRMGTMKWFSSAAGCVLV